MTVPTWLLLLGGLLVHHYAPPHVFFTSATPISTSVVFEGGTNDPSGAGVECTFTDLDPSLFSYSLTFEVYENDFSSTSEYVESIHVNGRALTMTGFPNSDNGDNFCPCLNNFALSESDVTVPPYLPSYLTVVSKATSSVNSYPYNGYVYYVRYTLHAQELRLGGPSYQLYQFTPLTLRYPSSTVIQLSELTFFDENGANIEYTGGHFEAINHW
jgi:hypothetical protein